MEKLKAYRAPRPKRNPLMGQDSLNYKDVDLLKKFLTPSGRISPARVAGTTPKQQRTLAQAVKRARFLALLPYIVRN